MPAVIFGAALVVLNAAGFEAPAEGACAHLLLLHDDTPDARSALAAVVGPYKRSCRQESVLWETATLCAAF
jgi:hypothetical protein